MFLLDLPLELHRLILERFVRNVGLKKAVHLRRVNRFFDRETMRALATTQVIEDRPVVLISDKAKSEYDEEHEDCLPRRLLFMARYFLQRPHTIQRYNHNKFSAWINQVLDKLATWPGSNSALQENCALRQQCMGTILKSFSESFIRWHMHPPADTPPPTEVDVLMSAIILHMVDVVKAASPKIDINRKWNYADSKPNWGLPLHTAIRTGSLEMVQAVLQPDTDVNIVERNSLPITIAAENGSREIVRALLEWPNGHCRTGIFINYAIKIAFHRGHFEIAWMIYDHADKSFIHDLYFIPDCLWATCIHGSVVDFQKLFERTTTQVCGRTVELWMGMAMQNAIMYGQMGILRLLVERGAKLKDCFEKISMRSVISDNYADVARLLLDEGLHRPERDWFYDLRWAAKLDNAGIIRLLLSRDVVDNEQRCEEADRFKAAMMAFACAHGNADLVKFYVEKGFPVEGPLYQNYYEAPPIVIAAAYGQPGVEKLLLDLGATQVDPLSTRWAEMFRKGEVPRRLDKIPLKDPGRYLKTNDQMEF